MHLAVLLRIIYLSRIPPGMGPSQVRHLLSRYGELGRVFLKHDDRGALAARDVDNP